MASVYCLINVSVFSVYCNVLSSWRGPGGAHGALCVVQNTAVFFCHVTTKLSMHPCDLHSVRCTTSDVRVAVSNSCLCSMSPEIHLVSTGSEAAVVSFFFVSYYFYHATYTAPHLKHV